MKSLLIIGGTGFFGKSFLDAFKRGLLSNWNIDKIIISSRNPEQLYITSPELFDKKIELLKLDITKAEKIPYADYVIHAAASTDASKYMILEEEEKKNIIQGTINYCDLAPKFHKESKIVFCSSGAVYGFQNPNEIYLKEDRVLNNIDKISDVKKSYALAKIKSEKKIIQLAENFGCKVSIARCFAFVGKYLPKNKHFAIGNFLNDAINSDFISVQSKHAVVRSYMYADDLVLWLMTIIDAASNKVDIFNVGSENYIEIHDLAKKIANQFKKKYKGKLIDQKIVDRYVPSTKLAREKLGLKEKITLDDAIRLSY